jgi:type IV secretory pathway VirB3-like protein
MYTLFRLGVTQPALLAGHAQAYVGLLSAELVDASALWQRRLWLNALLLSCLGVSLVLAGVALMLWAVIPIEFMRAPWALLLVPMVPAGAALWCLRQVRAQRSDAAFVDLLNQVRADLAMLREMAAA